MARVHRQINEDGTPALNPDGTPGLTTQLQVSTSQVINFFKLKSNLKASLPENINLTCLFSLKGC